MRLIKRWLMVVVCLVIVNTLAYGDATGPAPAATVVNTTQPLQLGGERFLFVDPAGLASTEHVQFVVNPPVARQVVLRDEKPWENIGENSNVIDDGSGIYKLYYLNGNRKKPNGELVSYQALATSTDGINWVKPNLGVIEFEGSKENNLVIEGGASGSVFYDSDEKNPEYRYKYMTSYPIDDKPNTPTTEGLVIYTSPDGIHWTKHEFQVYPYIQDSQAVMFKDPNIGKYVCYFRGNSEAIGRHVMRGETDDPLKPWPYTRNPNPLYFSNHELPYMDSVELPTVMARDNQDPPNADLYGNQVFLYPWAHRVYFAFPTCYYSYGGDRSYLSPKPGNVGVGECQLAVSRDGIKWTRYRRPAYLKHGWWGDHYAYWPWMFQGMIRRGDKIYQYAILRASGHGTIRFMKGSDESLNGVTLLEQPADRFVAAEFDYTGGRIVTEPLVFAGNRLVLNIDAGAMGEGRVAILDAEGKPIPGYTIEESDIINADWKEKTVAWNRGKSDVAPLAGRPVRLRFDMRGARLYAMQFAKE